MKEDYIPITEKLAYRIAARYLDRIPNAYLRRRTKIECRERVFVPTEFIEGRAASIREALRLFDIAATVDSPRLSLQLATRAMSAIENNRFLIEQEARPPICPWELVDSIMTAANCSGLEYSTFYRCPVLRYPAFDLRVGKASYRLGNFNIIIKNLSFDGVCGVTTSDTILSRSGYMHPHISTSGDVCFGNRRDEASNCVLAGKVFELAELLNLLVKNKPGKHPYCEIDDWTGYGRAICVICGTERAADDTYRCELCGGRYCFPCRNKEYDRLGLLFCAECVEADLGKTRAEPPSSYRPNPTFGGVL